MTQLIPSIGMSGRWILRTPLENLLQTNSVYTCRSVRSLDEYTGANEDPYRDIYVPIGLTDEDYEDDVFNKEYIVALQGADGKWVYVPTSYIEEFPNVDGVIYAKKIIMVVMPELPAALDLEPLMVKMKHDTFEMLGVNPQIHGNSYGPEILVDEDTHYNNMQEWANNKTFVQTDRVQIRVLETENIRLKALLTKLQQCMTGSCLVDGVIKLPTYNQDTPGHTGYMDAADLFPIKCIYPDNAVDLYLYGMHKPHRTVYPVTPPIDTDIDRSDPFEPPPSPGSTGTITPTDTLPNDTNPNVTHPTTPEDLFLNPTPPGEAIPVNNDVEFYPMQDESEPIDGGFNEVNDDMLDWILCYLYPDTYNTGMNTKHLFLKKRNNLP